MTGEPANDGELLQLLYLCPVAIAKLNAAGDVLLINAAGANVLMPIAPGGAIGNLYGLFAATPQIGEMARSFPRPSGRICDEYRVLASATSGERARSFILSITLQKIDEDAVIAVIADVTAAALREDATRATETRMNALFEGVKEYQIATFDLAGTVTSWNRAAESMNGFSADQIVGNSSRVLMPAGASGRSDIEPLLERALRQGWSESDGWRIRRDGSRYWANSAISILRDRNGTGEPLGFSMITRDLTEDQRRVEGLRQLAATDSLTGALSRRAFFEIALREERSLRVTERETAVLMLDLDAFKTINDRYGHPAGDEVLQAVTAAARREIRTSDAIGRYGGDEFIVLLSGAGILTATRIAERIRARIADTVIQSAGTPVRVTVSIGVAALGMESGDIASTIAAADKALYQAKHGGRNRVAAAPHTA